MNVRSSPSRRGFALLAVLWVIVGLATLSLAAALAARNAIAAARNRTELSRARWSALGCMEIARVVMAEVLLSPDRRDVRGLTGWSSLDAIVRNSPLLAASHCNVRLHAAGSRIDVNHADAEMLGAILARLGMQSPMRDSMVDALLDWRDADDIARPLGAERQWYVAHGRFPPRNGPFADVREIARVRGFETLGGLDSVLDIEPGRVSISHAPLAVIAALPGIDEEAVGRISEQRARGLPAVEIQELASGLSPDSRRALLARFSDLARFATVEPDAWIVVSRATIGAPAVSVEIEARLVRAGNRAAIVRRRARVL
jgi:general secretion pathway protein K